MKVQLMGLKGKDENGKHPLDAIRTMAALLGWDEEAMIREADADTKISKPSYSQSIAEQSFYMSWDAPKSLSGNPDVVFLCVSDSISDDDLQKFSSAINQAKAAANKPPIALVCVSDNISEENKKRLEGFASKNGLICHFGANEIKSLPKKCVDQKKQEEARQKWAIDQEAQAREEKIENERKVKDAKEIRRYNEQVMDILKIRYDELGKSIISRNKSAIRKIFVPSYQNDLKLVALNDLIKAAEKKQNINEKIDINTLIKEFELSNSQRYETGFAMKSMRVLGGESRFAKVLEKIKAIPFPTREEIPPKKFTSSKKTKK